MLRQTVHLPVSYPTLGRKGALVAGAFDASSNPTNSETVVLTPEAISSAVGKRLAERRRELGLSLAQVSAQCGVSLQQIHKYETGQTPLTVPMLVQLSRCLEAPMTYFLEPVAAPIEADAF